MKTMPLLALAGGAIWKIRLTVKEPVSGIPFGALSKYRYPSVLVFES